MSNNNKNSRLRNASVMVYLEIVKICENTSVYTYRLTCADYSGKRDRYLLVADE